VSHHTLDARRLLCPLPVIRAQDAVAKLHAGDTLEVSCTDPGALHDIPAWCRIHGHRVLETHTQDREVRIVLQVGETHNTP
jgi:tRNA 2-thiouridine synthesizing protein A